MNSCYASERLFDSTIAHSQDSLSHAFGLLAVMRHQQQGHARLAALTDEVFDASGRLLVERCSGLVEKQGFRLAAKGTSNGEPLALSGGKAADLPFESIGEPQRFDQRYRVRL